jgi:hypothetical protein
MVTMDKNIMLEKGRDSLESWDSGMGLQKVKKGGYDSLVMSVCCMLILAIVGWNMAFVVAEEEDFDFDCWFYEITCSNHESLAQAIKDGKPINEDAVEYIKNSLKSDLNNENVDGKSGLKSSLLLNRLTGKSFNLKGLTSEQIDGMRFFPAADAGQNLLSFPAKDGQNMIVNLDKSTYPDGLTSIELNGADGARYVFEDKSNPPKTETYTKSDGTLGERIKQSVLRIKNNGAYPVKDSKGNIVLKGLLTEDGKMINEDVPVNLGESGDGHVVIDGSDIQVKGKASISIGKMKIESLDTTVGDKAKFAEVTLLEDGVVRANGGARVHTEGGYFEVEESEKGVLLGGLTAKKSDDDTRALMFDTATNEVQGDLSGLGKSESVVFTRSGDEPISAYVNGMDDKVVTVEGKGNTLTFTKDGDKINVGVSAQKIGSVKKKTTSKNDPEKPTKEEEPRTGTPSGEKPNLPTAPGETDPSETDEEKKKRLADEKKKAEEKRRQEELDRQRGLGDTSGTRDSSSSSGLAGLLSNPLLLMGLLGAGLLAFLAFGGDDDEPPAQDVGCKIDPDTGNAEEGQDPEACGAEYNGEGDDEPGVNGDSTESDVATGASPEQEAAAQCACSPEGCDCSAVLDEPSVQGSTNTGADAGTTTGTATDDATVDE